MKRYLQIVVSVRPLSEKRAPFATLTVSSIGLASLAPSEWLGWSLAFPTATARCIALQKTGVKRGSGAKLALSGRALASPILITLNREFSDGFALEACFLTMDDGCTLFLPLPHGASHCMRGHSCPAKS